MRQCYSCLQADCNSSTLSSAETTDGGREPGLWASHAVSSSCWDQHELGADTGQQFSVKRHGGVFLVWV